ncbi:MAG: hypothetical protein ACOCQH_00595 [Halanaerobiales bacterium]
MTGIIDHISFARDWLKKAEERIKTGFPVEGEVFLSLAEAEIKRAGEKSRSMRAQNSRASAKKGFNTAVVLVLLLVSVWTGITYFQQIEGNEVELRLTEGYRQTNTFSEENGNLRLINSNLSINNNYERRN